MAAVSEEQAELLTLVTQCLERAALLGNSEFQGDKLKQRWAHNKATPFAWQKEAQRWIQSTQERYSTFLGPKGANGASRNPGISWNPLSPSSMENPNETLLREFCIFWKQALYFKPGAAKWFRGASREEREEARAMLFTDMPFKNVPDSVHPLCLIYYARAADSSGLEDALLSVFLEEESKLSDDGEMMSAPKKHPLTPMLRALLAFFALDYQGIVPEGNVDDEVHDRDPVDALRTALLTHYATAEFNPLTYNVYGIDASNELERLPHLDFLTMPLSENVVKLIMLLYERGGGSEEYPFAELPTLRDTNPELYTHIVDTMRRGAEGTVPRLDFTLASAAARAQHNQGGSFSDAQQLVAFRKCRELPSKKLQDAGLLCSEMSLFFRLDDFDNVICAVGSATSATAYECLHRLPYARGGFSSDANCMPLHWQAAAKLQIEYPDAIPQLLDRLPFSFMSVDSFLGRLWRYGLAAVVGGTVAEDLDSEEYRAKFTKWTEERCLAFERLEKYIEYQRAQRLVKSQKPDQKPTLDFTTGGSSKLVEFDQDEPSGNVSPDPDTTSAFSVNISSYSELQAASFIETQMSALEQGSSNINGRGLSPRPGSGSANNTMSPRDMNKMRLRELRQKRVALKNRGTGGSNLSRTSTLSQPFT